MGAALFKTLIKETFLSKPLNDGDSDTIESEDIRSILEFDEVQVNKKTTLLGDK